MVPRVFPQWARLLAVLVAITGAARAIAQDSADTRETRAKMLADKAIAYLQETGQAEDGSFSAAAGPGVTALVTTAMLRHGLDADEPHVAKALAYLETFIQDDGGIYGEGSLYQNYETSLAVMCFIEANRQGRYDPVIRRADTYLRGGQWDETKGIEASNPAYGGFGYGRHGRPDLSNTSFTIEALRAAGAGPDDAAIQRAIRFVSRTQNLESPHNDTPHAGKISDGGFYYTPAAGGQSQAETTENGGLRSYASMTYAGFKSLLHAGVDENDPRVRAAVEWIKKNYDLRTNPGLGADGLFYYYHVFAKALDAAGFESFVDADGTEHDWRAELVAALAECQQPNGSWVNSASERWLENDPPLVTGYALLALSYCRKPTP